MATYTVANGGGNINAASTYVGGVGVPGAADTIVFTTTSGQLTVNVVTTIQDIDFSNYTNVITFSGTLNVSRNITFGDAGGLSTYTTAGAGGIQKTGTGNLTSNGKTWTAPFTFGAGTYTVTLMDLCVFSNTINFGNNNTVTLNSNNVLDPERFNVTGDFTLSGGGALIGTALIKFTGTSNQTLAAATLATIRVNIKIDKTGGTLTFTGSLNYNTGTFTYIQGNTNTGTSTLIISTATTTMNTNGSSTSGATVTSSTGINWYNVTLSTTLSLTSNFTVINTLTANVGTITRAASEDVYLGGNLTMTSTLTSTAAAVIMNGTGTWSGAGAVTAPLTINTTGTITISGSVTFSTRTLTYTTATSVVTTGSTLNITASCTLATNGITWNNITTTGTGTTTITLSSNLTWSGTMSLLTNLVNGNGATRTVTFSGASLTSISTANMNIGSEQYGNNSQTTVVNFPTSSTLSITNLTVGCGGNSGVGYNTTLNNVTFNISGNFTTNFTNQNISRVTGTSSQINMVGTGTIIQTGSNAITYLSIPININTIGTITISGIYYFETTVTYTSGTIVGSGTSVFVTSTLNLNAGGKWGTDANIRGNTTLTSNATFGNLTTNTTAVVFSGAFTINVEGNLAINIATSGASTPIVLNGTVAQSWTHGSAVYLSNNLTINKASGTLTIGSLALPNVYYQTGTLTYNNIGGTVDAATNLSTLNIGASTTLNTNGITWNNVTTSGTTTLTLSSNFNITNLTVNSGCILSFSGTGLSISGNLTMGGVSNGASTFNVPNNLTITNFSTYLQLATNNYTLNGNTISITGNLTVNMNNNNGVLGTTTLKMIGTGNLTFSNSSNTNFISNPFTIDTAGTITTAGPGTPLFSSTTVTYTSGTITGVGVIFSACTLNLNSGGQWGTDVTIRGTTTLTSNATFGNITTNTTAAAIGGAFTINVKGNLAINVATSGAASIVLNGTGNQSWTHGSAVYISNNITINKASGTLTLGANVYYTVGTLTYTQGDVDVTTNNNAFFVTGGTYNVEGLNFNTFYFATSGVSSITLASNLYARTFTCGGNSTINGAFDIYCSYFNMNNSSTGQISASLSFPRTIYCAIDATFSGATATNVCTFTGNLYVGGSCYHNAPSTSNQGAANLFMVGNGELRAPSIAGTFISNLYFNTSGKVTITGSISYALGAARTINLIKGNIDARKATLTLNRTFTHTLINMNKMVWGNVILDTVSVQTLNMNEFFCGDATTQTNITTNTTTNAIVTFTDNFEKIAKFVNINGITFTRPQQLLLLTNQPKKSRNIGIRYNNQSPNGISKGKPSINTTLTPGLGSFLVSDPIYN